MLFRSSMFIWFLQITGERGSVFASLYWLGVFLNVVSVATLWFTWKRFENLYRLSAVVLIFVGAPIWWPLLGTIYYIVQGGMY